MTEQHNAEKGLYPHQPRGQASHGVEASELESLAADPLTDWDVLHWIAENYPGLRPTVAANPGTYQELVDALGHLGDPAVDAAIAQRRRSRNISAQAAATNPLAGMYETYTQGIPAYREDRNGSSRYEYKDLDYSQPDYGHGYGQGMRVAGYAELPDPSADESAAEQLMDTVAADESPPALPGPRHSAETPEAADADDDADTAPVARVAPVPPAAPGVAPSAGPESEAQPHQDTEPDDEPVPYAAAPAAAPAATAAPAPPPPEAPEVPPATQATAAQPAHGQPAYVEEEKRRRAGAGLLILGTLLVLVGIGAAVALVMMLFGGDDEQPVADPDPGGDQAQQAEEEAAEEDEQNGAAELDEARAEAAGLPEASDCESGQDASVVAEFLSAGEGSDGFPAEEDSAVLEETFTGLQEECSNTYAAGVFEAARSGEQAPEGDAGTALTAVGTGWVDRSMGPPDAEQMDSFSMHGGNIQCEFDDGVRCTVYNHEYPAPEGCEEGTTYQMQVDGGTAEHHCEDPVQAEPDRDTLQENEAATDGFLVCVNTSDRVSCYNSVDGSGFELSEIGEYALNY